MSTSDGSSLTRHLSLSDPDQGMDWEQANLGKNTKTRLRRLGRDSLNWRDDMGLTRNYQDDQYQKQFHDRIHNYGKDFLSMMLAIDEANESGEAMGEAIKNKIVNSARQQGHEASTRLQSKKIRVKDLESGDQQLSDKIDKEWNTSNWTKDMVLDGVSALLEIFYDSKNVDTEHKKTLACTMLLKMITRHAEAEDHLRQNISQVAGLAANRFLIGGKSAGVLDLLYIVDSLKEKFMKELSECMITRRIQDMLTIELRLGTLLMQHMVRVHQLKRRYQKNLLTANPKTLEFGNSNELYADMVNAAAVRTKELKARWNTMHVFNQASTRTSIGTRGPVYLGITYTTVCLSIVNCMVTDSDKNLFVNSNREDAIRSNGCVMYTQMIGCPAGKFSKTALSIMAQLSKMPECFVHAINGGIVRSCHKYLTFLLVTGKLQLIFSQKKNDSEKKCIRPSTVQQQRENEIEIDMKTTKLAVFDALHILVNLSLHAAGVHRGRKGYNFEKYCPIIKEDIDYQYTYKEHKKRLTPLNIQTLLSQRDLMTLLFQLISITSNINITRYVLRILCGMGGSDAHKVVVEYLIMDGGKNLTNLLRFVDESDTTIHCLALTFFLQITCKQFGRDQLMYARFPQLLYEYIQYSVTASNVMMNDNENQSIVGRKEEEGISISKDPLPTSSAAMILGSAISQSYERFILIVASMLRQDEWRFYEPMKTPATYSNHMHIHDDIYLDLLKTIKSVPVKDTMASDTLTIADLIVLPTDVDKTMEMSIMVEALGAREIAECLCHPGNDEYFILLPWDKAIAGCVILDGLTFHEKVLENLYSTGISFYLGQCLKLSRFLFDHPMKDPMLLMVLNGVKSAANALSKICLYCTKSQTEIENIIIGIRKSDLLHVSHFFVHILSEHDPLMDPLLLRLKMETATAILCFYRDYTKLIARLPKNTNGTKIDALYEELNEMSKIVTNLIKIIPDVHGKTILSKQVMKLMCEYMAEFTKLKKNCDLAIYEWHIFDALQQVLPSILSSLYDSDIFSMDFKTGHGFTSDSFYDLATTLCKLDIACTFCLNCGILRRALEKNMLLVDKLFEFESYSGDKSWSPITKDALVEVEQEEARLLVLRNKNALLEKLEGEFEYGTDDQDYRQTSKENGFKIDLALATTDKKMSDHRRKLLESGQEIIKENRIECAACLNLIAKLGSFSKKGGGTANDLILNPKYNIVKLCVGIINDNDHFHRHETVITAALNVLSTLASDGNRLRDEFEQYKVLECVRQQLLQAESLDVQGVEYALHTLYHSIAVRTAYVTKCLPTMKVALAKVNRTLPQFHDFINETNWNMACRLNSFKETEEDTQNAFHAQEYHSNCIPDNNIIKMDSILMDRLKDLYEEAGIDHDEEMGRLQKETTEIQGYRKEAAKYEKDTREWHNPSYKNAMKMSSPQEVRDRNFLIDSMVEDDIPMPTTGGVSQESPFSMKQFIASSISEPHRKEFLKMNAKNLGLKIDVGDCLGDRFDFEDKTIGNRDKDKFTSSSSGSQTRPMEYILSSPQAQSILQSDVYKNGWIDSPPVHSNKKKEKDGMFLPDIHMDNASHGSPASLSSSYSLSSSQSATSSPAKDSQISPSKYNFTSPIASSNRKVASSGKSFSKKSSAQKKNKKEGTNSNNNSNLGSPIHIVDILDDDAAELKATRPKKGEMIMII